MNGTNTDLKAGEVVKLKSGGPWMTIDEVYNDNTFARCIWFDKDGKLQTQSFSVIVIEKYQ